MDRPESLLTTAGMASVDRAAVASGLPIERLIERAGRAVALALAEALPGPARVAVLCGPGHNGCDGFLAAARLAEGGHAVRCFAAADAAPGSTADWARRRWGGATEPVDAFAPADFDAAIDALYGAGLSRPLAGAEAEAVRRLKASAILVLAVDLPSGLDGDSGLPLGPHVEADRTVTFVRRKPGHLLWPGRKLCGAVSVADISIDPAIVEAAALAACFANAPALWRAAVPKTDPDGHKYHRGYVLSVSGPEFQTGAARLAAIAALNAGAGAVALAGDLAALRVHAAHVTAIMLKIAENAEALAGLLEQRRFAAAVIGPASGIGPETAAKVEALLRAGVPSVLDADALTSLAGRMADLRSRPEPGSPLILTPHTGEFDRVFAEALQEDAVFAALPARLQASKLERARAAARIVCGVVVLKGVDTVVADADGRACINENGGPELATAGSGDVLAGLAAGHLAQGMPAFEAAAAAVWLHGAAGASVGLGLTADRLAAAVRPLGAFL